MNKTEKGGKKYLVRYWFACEDIHDNLEDARATVKRIEGDENRKDIEIIEMETTLSKVYEQKR